MLNQDHFKRYRLRKGNNIVGYAQYTSQGLCIRSNRAFWWFPGILTYDHTDEYVGLKDAKGNEIYELDVVRCKSFLKDQKDWFEAVVLWERKEGLFGLLDTSTRDFFPINLGAFFLFNSEDLIVSTQLFMHPDLIRDLGLEHCI